LLNVTKILPKPIKEHFQEENDWAIPPQNKYIVLFQAEAGALLNSAV
jgi:hypothetical protein